jgi:hypothetical protein
VSAGSAASLCCCGLVGNYSAGLCKEDVLLSSTSCNGAPHMPSVLTAPTSAAAFASVLCARGDSLGTGARQAAATDGGSHAAAPTTPYRPSTLQRSGTSCCSGGPASCPDLPRQHTGPRPAATTAAAGHVAAAAGGGGSGCSPGTAGSTAGGCFGTGSVPPACPVGRGAVGCTGSAPGAAGAPG